MSNTSTLTPYSGDASASGSICAGAIAACVIGTAVVAAGIVKWLLDETPEDKEAVNRLKDQKRADRLATVDLRLRDVKTLLESARKIGYQAVTGVNAGTVPVSADEPCLLVNSLTGRRIAISRTPAGNIAITTTGGVDIVESIVRQHTVDRIAEHLSQRYADIQLAELDTGEVQLVALQERTPRQIEDSTRIKTQIYPDGRVWVDVEGVKGNRCQEIVAGMAEAAGVSISSMHMKQRGSLTLPGEPVRPRVRT